MEKAGECFVKWFTGGLVYFYLEILFRGYSHYSMFICGGLCFLLVGAVGEKLIETPMNNVVRIFLVMIAGMLIITMAELITGLIVNNYLKMNVWDYSGMKYNFRGQICLTFSAIWACVSLVCVYMDYMIKMFLFSE